MLFRLVRLASLIAGVAFGVIPDAGLVKVDMSTFMANKTHPGKDRKDGFLGRAGHSDPVAFKDVAIKKL